MDHDYRGGLRIAKGVPEVRLQPALMQATAAGLQDQDT